MRFFDTPVEYLKGVGPIRATLLNKELSIFTFGELLQHYPFRYEDRTHYLSISELSEQSPYVLTKGRIVKKELTGVGRKKRLTCELTDGKDSIELVWFQGINWITSKLQTGIEYSVFGKPNRYGHRLSIAHPEVEPFVETKSSSGSFYPVYPITEKLRAKHLDSKAISRLMKELLQLAGSRIHETLPKNLLENKRLLQKSLAIKAIHFPENSELLHKAQYRLKFEELFYIQLRLLRLKLVREEKFKGQVFDRAELVTTFHRDYLPFELTNAQKKVIKEIYQDLRSGKQMNRLVQGDVGSGKTIVAFICMLIVIGGGAQCVLMAPTEILAQQHYQNLRVLCTKMGLSIALLTGSVKAKERKQLHHSLQEGSLNILVGTHALLEDEVAFKNLGLAVIDEQHRFGVAQRSKLWHKNAKVLPHVLVMTATPIPRTLAMTLYGDLDISAIDELPKGRRPIKTLHKFDSHRLEINSFLKSQIGEGRQVYIVYPLIEESEKLDLKHVMDGYESICRAFPEIPVSILHGKMKSEAKEWEMDRFVRNETKIMVATTVIEVGVDVPNASVMIIENAERFGLSQLHQLRGRVGRGAEQSYCLLVTGYKLSADSGKRIDTMVRTNNGFEIAETDLELRGPGDLMGTQQSGALDLTISDLVKDGNVLKEAREEAIRVLSADPDLSSRENLPIRTHIESLRGPSLGWNRIS